MRSDHGRSVLIAGAATAVLAGALLAPAAAGAAAARPIPVVRATLGAHVSLSRTHLSPGRVTFEVHGLKGEHTLQILSLHKGYALGQAEQDFGAAFGGNVAAVRRIDAGVSFKGGVPGRPRRPGHVTMYLSAGTYYALDLDGNAITRFTVAGAAVTRRTVSTNSRVTMLTYGFDAASRLARRGEMRLTNTSDQPHFLVIQQVKPGTTATQVRSYFASGAQADPPWLLKASTSTGVLSPTKTEAFSYSLPAGRYVLACFWPDDETGMPHAAMGMWKLVTLH